MSNINKFSNQELLTPQGSIVAEQSEFRIETSPKSDRKIRVLLAITVLGTGGATNVVLDLANHLNQNPDFDVLLLTGPIPSSRTDLTPLAHEMNIPTQMVPNLINHIDQELFGEKIVIFTDQIETFNAYYKVFKDVFGDEVTGFAESINRDKAEVNIYRFQSDPNCKMLICDKSGGEGRNLQIADYVIHLDLPWNINTIEQRIGRLDRMGRNVKKPVTSVVIHSVDSYEEQLFKTNPSIIHYSSIFSITESRSREK